MSLPTSRPARYVPRHSTREPVPAWDEREVVDLTEARTPPAVVLASVLSGLSGLRSPAEERGPATGG
ncbi:hypothetical protein [Kineococcus rhizosphaerae]|uniref:Uncharacterized protein n=1 Tax=Kineococcus rhizosphaerae TaxID=559628 RepID=A0A2T0RB59_9ACTN|nr:hypothetical protein [Kineococcus rhizosphaerae]PRY18387.1 hypothetical protein CLV37_101632 [Kineococcus rhizosphaerae]